MQFPLNEMTVYPHTYTGASVHNIATYGKNIMGLDCPNMQLSNLDVGENTRW